MANAEVGSAYVTIYPQTDGNFSKQVGKNIESGLSTKAVAVGNIVSDVVMNAVDAVANGVQAVISGAFEGFSEYEQLAGGVEKIFDQADISKIFADAQGAYKDLNMSANEYLASINQVGAAFAQTMGDQKGYDTARTGMKAIADYASGTGRNLDELNEKYALITRSTSSYQSIADQFSGILPATSADFLAQAQAAGLLSGEYTKLTEVPVAEYQQAVSQMLEQGVKDMGLYGNTMHESTETISGSLAMLKSSWENMLTELGKDDGNIDARVQELVDSAVAVIENVGPRLVEIGSHIMEAVPEIVEKLQPYIDQFVASAKSFIEAHQPEIEAAGQVLFDGISKGISFALRAALPALGEAIKNIVLTFPEWFPQFQQAGFDLFLAVVEGVCLGVQPFFNELENAVNGALSNLGNAVGGFFKAGFDIVGGIADGVRSGVGKVRSVFDSIKSAIGSAIGAAKNLVKGAVDGIKGTIEGIKGVVGTVRSTFNSIKSAITDPINRAKDTVKGVIDKIKGLFPLNVGKIFSNLQIPHISVNGGSPPFGIGGKGSLPSFNVSWHAKGAIFTKPTILGGTVGVGEAGPEAVLPIDRLPELLGMDDGQSDGRPNVYVGDISVSPSSALYDLLMELGETIVEDRRRAGKAVA